MGCQASCSCSLSLSLFVCLGLSIGLPLFYFGFSDTEGFGPRPRLLPAFGSPMDTAKRRKLRFFVACSLGFLSLCLRTRSPLVFSQTLPARVVSHTKMQVHSPWSKEFEANWQVPPEALSGSLLRHDGNYVAALEWASQADCDAWLGQPGMEQTRQSTVQYVVCGAVPSASSELDDKTSAGSAPQKAFARDLMDNALGGGIRSRADFEALQAPEVDPSVLFAISAGDDVDIEESDEVLISGGDPSFLNDDKWSSSSQVAEKQQKTQLDLAHTTEAEDEDDEEDVLFHGGDPTFLDDTLWGDQADKKVEEWDGREDDTAHLFD